MIFFLIIIFCIENQEEHDQSKTTPSVGEGAEGLMAIDLKEDNFSVSVFIILWMYYFIYVQKC